MQKPINSVDSNFQKPWYNRSFLAKNGGFLYYFCLTVGQIFNPVMWAMSTEILIVIFSLIANSSKIENKELFLIPTLNTLKDFHHLYLPSLTTIVGLYAIFKQRRPEPKIGTIYGMPSGDSLFGGIISSVSYVFTESIWCFIIFFLISLSRVLKGYHTIGQVTFGSVLGLSIGFLYTIPKNPTFMLNKYYPKNFNNNFIIINWLLAFFLPPIIFFDKNTCDPSKINPGSNLHQWVFMDAIYLVFDGIICFPDSFYENFDSTFNIFPNLRLMIGVFFVIVFLTIGNYMGDKIVISFFVDLLEKKHK